MRKAFKEAVLLQLLLKKFASQVAGAIKNKKIKIKISSCQRPDEQLIYSLDQRLDRRIRHSRRIDRKNFEGKRWMTAPLISCLPRRLLDSVGTHQLILNRQFSEYSPIPDCFGCPPPPTIVEPEEEKLPCTHLHVQSEDEKLQGIECEPVVAIVGGGIAGLSAANRLFQVGLSKVIVFESSDRIGGRINSVKFGDNGIAELGAEWIAGGNASNPLYILANREGLLDNNIDFQDCKNVICITCDGTIICADICRLAKRAFNIIRTDASSLYRLGNNQGTLLNFITMKSKDVLNRLSDDSREKVHRVLVALQNNIRTRWGADLAKMSSFLYGSYSGLPGSSIRPNHGMINALKPLLKNIPPKQIFCCSPVCQIVWNDPRSRVVIKYGNDEEFLADYVIVTVPLGVLKKNHEKLFYPSLPAKKVQAIENIGFGCLTKIFMKYEREFWGNERTSIRTVWRLRDWSERNMIWYKGISNIEVKGDTLSCTVAGSEALAVEKAPVNEIANDLNSVVRRFTNCNFIPMPCDVLVSSWNGDPNYHGAVSFMSKKTKQEDQYALSEPVPNGCNCPKILFAGEAASGSQFSSAHGARSSGLEQANRIIEFTKQFGGRPPK